MRCIEMPQKLNPAIAISSRVGEAYGQSTNEAGRSEYDHILGRGNMSVRIRC